MRFSDRASGIKITGYNCRNHRNNRSMNQQALWYVLQGCNFVQAKVHSSARDMQLHKFPPFMAPVLMRTMPRPGYAPNRLADGGGIQTSCSRNIWSRTYNSVLPIEFEAYA
jgi:hypothetical protein